MKIGIEATCWQNNRGYGRHARALFGTLIQHDSKNQYTLFMDSTESQIPIPAQASVRQVQTSTPAAIAAAADGSRSLRDMWQISREMSAADLDLIIFPTVYTYVPVFTRAKKLVMIHDVIAETYPQLTLPNRRARLFWQTKVALGRWQADALVTVSEYSRQRMASHFKMSPDHIYVVGEASDPIFRKIDQPQLTGDLARLGLGLDGRYVLYVGGFGPHKNLESLITSFASLAKKDRFAGISLIMVGEYQKETFHSEYSSLIAQIRQFGIEDQVCFTGYLPDESLVILLNLAQVLVLPSYMEGFGLPAVEASACGCPVIATNASPLPSLLGKAGIYIDPGKPDQLESALANVLGSENVRQRMGEAGLAAASNLTWGSAAEQMLNVIEQVTTT